MANESTDKEFTELLAEAKLTEEKFAELLAEAAKKTAEHGNITVATEEEVSALTDILAMKEEEARRYNQMGKELEEKDLYDNAVKWYIKAAELALNIAPRSGVVVQSLHSVAHNKIYQYEQRREGVYTKYTKPEQCARSGRASQFRLFLSLRHSSPPRFVCRGQTRKSPRMVYQSRATRTRRSAIPRRQRHIQRQRNTGRHDR